MENPANHTDIPPTAASNLVCGLDLDEILNRDDFTFEDVTSQDAFLHTCNQDTFTSTGALHRQHDDFVVQDGFVRPDTLLHTFNQADIPDTGNLFQYEIDRMLQQGGNIPGSITQLDWPYGLVNSQSFFGIGVLSSHGCDDIFDPAQMPQASSQMNLPTAPSQGDLNAPPERRGQRGGGPMKDMKSLGKPRASRYIQRDEWEALKEPLERFWVRENHTMKEVIEEMTQLYGFTASARTYRDQFKRWKFPLKNKTKRTGEAEVARRYDDERNLPRKRPAHSLPKEQVKKAILNMLSKASVPSSKACKTFEFQENMVHSLDVLVKGIFDKRNGWSYSKFEFVPPSETVDNSKDWRLLTDQCYSAVTLAETGLSSRVNSCLQRMFRGLHKTASGCNPNVLVYFWRMCVSITKIRLFGKLKMETYPLLRIFLRYLERRLSSALGGHAVVDFLSSLNHILEAEPESLRIALGRGYEKTINSLMRILGQDHAIVLSMVSHYSKHWRTKLKREKQQREEQEPEASLNSLSDQYRHLIDTAQVTYGSFGEQTISILYDYALLNEIDPALVHTLQERTAEMCRGQRNLKCTLTSQAFAFSTELLTNMYGQKEAKRSSEYLDQAIEILRHGDQECLIWAASFSKRLSRWQDGNRQPCKEEKNRTKAIRSRIEENRPEMPKKAAHRSARDFKIHVQKQRRKAHETVVSSLVENLEL